MSRRLLGLLGLLAVSAAHAAPQASPPPARVIPVYEATIAPGTLYDYGACDPDDYEFSTFTRSIASTKAECEAKTTFNWSSAALPTLAQRKELCNCTGLIERLQLETVPRCSVMKDKMTISYAAFFTYAFYLCTTTTPVRTTAAPLYTPTTTAPSSSSDESSSKAPLIFGIGGGVVACLIIACVVVKCRKKREPEPSGAAPRKGDAERAEDDDFILEATPLSPMGRYPTTDYVSVAASPKPGDTNDTNTTNETSGNSQSSSRNSSHHTLRSAERAPAAGSAHASSEGRLSTGPSSQRSNRSVVRAQAPMAPTHTPRQAMWDDEVIIAVRVPLDAVFFGPLLASGGFGEVYRGTYRGETVAIKQLLPARRKDLAQIDDFLGEVKLMASLDHERIVRFIGVAWNSLSDVCAVVEYMENGDLRSVLTRWDGEEMRPQGFDADKVKIALHVAHALTYLHSLQPVVVHRDLKSKNILLTASLDAKITDFGVSRERADSTMTAGVGSSLWMAPEVMMGERYNEKADVFSFGVVLSELDTQQLPYTQAKLAAPDQRLPDSAILQRVALGRLRVSFSELADADLVQLGYDCVQVDPSQRPTTAEVLHRVHLASRRIF